MPSPLLPACCTASQVHLGPGSQAEWLFGPLACCPCLLVPSRLLHSGQKQHLNAAVLCMCLFLLPLSLLLVGVHCNVLGREQGNKAQQRPATAEHALPALPACVPPICSCRAGGGAGDSDGRRGTCAGDAGQCRGSQAVGGRAEGRGRVGGWAGLVGVLLLTT